MNFFLFFSNIKIKITVLNLLRYNGCLVEIKPLEKKKTIEILNYYYFFFFPKAIIEFCLRT